MNDDYPDDGPVEGDRVRLHCEKHGWYSCEWSEDGNPCPCPKCEQEDQEDRYRESHEPKVNYPYMG